MAENNPTDVTADEAQSQVAVVAEPTQDVETQLLRQIEFYFSKENLAKDTYLVSQMNSDNYVDLSVIAGFGKVKQLTTDVAKIAEVLENSSVCKLDETKTKVRAAPKLQRNTVIIRDTPPGTTLETIQELWKTSEFKSISNIRPDIANCWFVTFDSEEEAADAVFWVRNQKLDGQRIHARVKAENNPSYFCGPPMPTVEVPNIYQGVPFPVGGSWVPDMRFNYAVWDGQQDGNANRQYEKGQDNRRGRYNRRNKDGFKKGQRDGRKRNGGRKQQAQAQNPKKPQEFKLGAANFPPLPTKGSVAPSNAQQYSPSEFVEVLKQQPNVEKPEDISSECAAVTDSPNTEVAEPPAQTESQEPQAAAVETEEKETEVSEIPEAKAAEDADEQKEVTVDEDGKQTTWAEKIAKTSA